MLSATFSCISLGVRMSNLVSYVSLENGEHILAHQIQKGHRQTLTDHYGDSVTATEGDYVIVDPYTEVIDEATFEREYVERTHAKR